MSQSLDISDQDFDRREVTLYKRPALAALVVTTAIALIASACGADNAAAPLKTSTPLVTSTAESVSTEAIAAARNFDGFPIVWLGESYDSDGDGVGDHELTSAYASSGQAFPTTESGQEVLPAIQSFTLGYGDCDIPFGDHSCPIPIGIVLYPPDNKLPPLAGGGRNIVVRGVEGTPYNEGLWIETADFTIAIAVASGDRYEESLRIAERLVGANSKASHVTAGSNFRPPPPMPTPDATELAKPPTVGLNPRIDHTSIPGQRLRRRSPHRRPTLVPRRLAR